jgi:hypothetical protein
MEVEDTEGGFQPRRGRQSLAQESIDETNPCWKVKFRNSPLHCEPRRLVLLPFREKRRSGG